MQLEVETSIFRRLSLVLSLSAQDDLVYAIVWMRFIENSLKITGLFPLDCKMRYRGLKMSNDTYVIVLVRLHEIELRLAQLLEECESTPVLLGRCMKPRD